MEAKIAGFEYEMSKPNYVDRGEKDSIAQHKADLSEQKALLADLEAQLTALK
ncbi:hypothetical protein MKY92_21670 [Paenibacillus sp. FSL R5-0623]|uniref:hypothetical protein n=1 Tax=Paenibacillus sp. FSL R5-0623 TaxID=2921651 RepID=UPI0030DCE541